MPLFYTSARIGFSVPEWARIWGTFFLVQPVTNVVWGLIGDRIGWMRQMRWVGFVGCGTASLLFYWLPLHFPHNTLAATVAALLFAFTITSFVPMGAIFPMMEPEHKGAAVGAEPRRRPGKLRRSGAGRADSSFLGNRRRGRRLRSLITARRCSRCSSTWTSPRAYRRPHWRRTERTGIGNLLRGRQPEV